MKRNIPFKKWLIRRVAIDTVVDERIVDKVVSHQFEKARDAMSSSDSIELSGFGRFYFNRKKAKRKIERYKGIKKLFEDVINDENTSDKKRASSQFKLGRLLGDIKLLERKIGNED